MNRKAIIIASIVCSFILGVVASDVASLKKFPHGRYLLDMKFDGSPWSTYVCERNGSAFGENFSTFDSEHGVQRDCLLYTSGEPLLDGSFDVYLGSQTWLGRVKNLKSPVHVPAKAIRSVKPVDY